ncbi:MAG: MerR family transcriptional regulator [Gammaproteobacteria bacterium]|nr:MerR family transcriptional regulator [Gammaproteobacteria bacterium]MBI5616928.1 MerR family transcriptional regulator [Gammaproteobacteria bacterium]
MSYAAGKPVAEEVPVPLQVKQLAAECGVGLDTVRHDARLGLLAPERHPGNGYKLFDARDAERLAFVKRASPLGFTLAEVKEILDRSAAGRSPCPMVRETFGRRLKENRARLERELLGQRRMEKAFADWQNMEDGAPDGHSVCRLIDSVAIGEAAPAKRKRR